MTDLLGGAATTRQPGVFGFLATRFSSQAEDLATEALAYVLHRSEAGAAAFEEYLRSSTPVPGGLHYRTQLGGEDGAVPDLAGTASDGSTPVLVEAKFWAGLTARQPVTYLRRLPMDGPSVLLFVVPSVRIGLLWNEVVDRASREEFVLSSEQGRPEYRWVGVGNGRHLAMTSWPALLTFLIERVTIAGDAAARSDLEQLLGLCRRMDGEGFVPLDPEELSGSTAARLVQFTDLIDRAVADLVASGRASRRSADGTSLAASAGVGWWGRFFSAGNAVCLLRVSAGPWARDRATPLWLQVGYRGQPSVAQLLHALAPLRVERDRVFPRPDYVDVAIDLPVGQERDAVVQSIVDQIDAVASLLGEITSPRTELA